MTQTLTVMILLQKHSLTHSLTTCFFYYCLDFTGTRCEPDGLAYIYIQVRIQFCFFLIKKSFKFKVSELHKMCKYDFAKCDLFGHSLSNVRNLPAT